MRQLQIHPSYTLLAVAAAVLLAACNGTDGPHEGDTQVVPPAQPPSLQEPHYPEQPPVRDTVPGAVTPGAGGVGDPGSPTGATGGTGSAGGTPGTGG